MGGIFGIISKDGDAVSEADLSLMKEKLAHLGVDGSGIKTFPGAGLGYLHFSLFPEYEKEVGPYEYGPWVITADARLDAREELVRALEMPLSEGLRTPDNILIVKAYEKWGEKCLDHLIGDFAFAIWDKRTRTLFAARDFAGIRPLFYYDGPDRFVFSSEIRAIAALDWVPKKLHEGKLRDYLLTIPFSGDYVADTFFKGIQRLMPGRFLLYDLKELFIKKYWSPPEGKWIKYSTDEEYAEAFSRIIVQSVHDRIKTPHPVGVTLSGGLDSSSIACVAAQKLSQENRKLFSASSVMPENHDGLEEDEKEYIQEVLSQESNIQPEFVTAGKRGVFEGIEGVFERTYHPVNVFHYIDRAIFSTFSDNHTRLVLSGFGGDMAASFFGKNIFRNTLKVFRVSSLIKIIKQFGKIYRLRPWQFFKVVFLIPAIPRNWRLSYLKLRKRKGPSVFDVTALAMPETREGRKQVQRYYNRVWDLIKQNWDVHKSIWNTDVILLLEEEAVLSGAHSIHVTYPLLDKRVIEFLLRLPPDKFLLGGWDRGLIRYAMKEIVPDKNIWRHNKTMYSPDYNRRLLREKSDLLRKLEATQHASCYNQFIDFERIRNSFDKLEIKANWENFDNKAITITGIGLMALHFLEFFKKRHNLHEISSNKKDIL